MENEVIASEYRHYYDYKKAMDNEVQKSAEGFVRIGYLLKVARDTQVLQESQYHTMAEFAEKEYGLDASQVTRFVHINDRFSIGGYSEDLEGKYQGYGYTKLALMLQLPDEINNIITPEFTRNDIQALKDEVDEEKKVSDVEVAIEAAGVKNSNSMLQRCMYQLMHDHPDLFAVARMDFDTVTDDIDKIRKNLAEQMAPSGETVIVVRITGIGKVMISVRGESLPVTLIQVRTEEKEEHQWDEIIDIVKEIVSSTPGNSKDAWEAYFGEPFPEEEKAEIVPEQSPEKPKSEIKKPAKVIKSKTESPKPAKVPAREGIPKPQMPENIEKVSENASTASCEQPGDIMPAPVNDNNETAGDKADAVIDNSSDEVRPAAGEGIDKYKEYKASILCKADDIINALNDNNFGLILLKARAIADIANTVRKMEEEMEEEDD